MPCRPAEPERACPPSQAPSFSPFSFLSSCLARFLCVLIPIPHLSASRRSSRRGESCASKRDAPRHGGSRQAQLRRGWICPARIHPFLPQADAYQRHARTTRTYGGASLGAGERRGRPGPAAAGGHGGDEPGVQYVSVLAWTATPRARRLTAGRWGRPAAPAETAARTEATSLFCSVVAHAAAS